MRALGLFPVIMGLAIALCLPCPAMAEKLVFDHRLSPPLKAVLDEGKTEMVLFDTSNPRYIIDRIAVTGKSAEYWTEALEIIARSPAKNMKTSADWMAELRDQADKLCPNEVSVIAQDLASITYQRLSLRCPKERAPYSIYRVIAGKRSLFLLAVLSKSELNETARRQWLALLASAHLE